jgi:hypothetical protein
MNVYIYLVFSIFYADLFVFLSAMSGYEMGCGTNLQNSDMTSARTGSNSNNNNNNIRINKQ